jgi:hypothetical protein
MLVSIKHYHKSSNKSSQLNLLAAIPSCKHHVCSARISARFDSRTAISAAKSVRSSGGTCIGDLTRIRWYSLVDGALLIFSSVSYPVIPSNRCHISVVVIGSSLLWFAPLSVVIQFIRPRLAFLLRDFTSIHSVEASFISVAFPQLFALFFSLDSD